MGWLKQDFIKRALGAIGMADFDASAEQLSAALQTLDSMMAAWNADGIRLSYPLPSTADGSDVSQDSGVPDRANLAIWTNLALLLASEIGRDVSVTLQKNAAQGYAALLAAALAEPEEMQMPLGTLAGAGHKRRARIGRVFLDPPTDSLDAGPDSELEID